MKPVVKCQDCQFFKNGRHPQQGKPCSELGYKTFAKACSLYQPNTSQMVQHLDVLQAMGKVSKEMEDSEARILSWLINNIPNLKKAGFTFGQPVYINLSSPQIDFVNCWFKAHVVNVITLKDYDGANVYHVQVVSSITETNPTMLTMPLSSLLTLAQWKAHKRELEKEGLVKIPSSLKTHSIKYKLNQPLNRVVRESLEDVPTIDTVPSKWLDNRRHAMLIDPLQVETVKKKPTSGAKVGNPSSKPKPRTKDRAKVFKVTYDSDQ